ncbi:MAG: aldose 1-epimerase family protein [Lentisphaerales bacterium]|nr:aldose 1-epimerase family protein [Lentisphaerales bacterium]
MIIESKFLKAEFSTKGAELASLQDQFGAQYIWQGKEEFWPGKAPLMFPICGFLKENCFYHKNNQYFMQVHGFARTSDFEILEHDLQSISFKLKSSAKIRQHFPFVFEFIVNYELNDNKLKVNFLVKNLDSQRMYFSLGWHPGFALNWTPNDSIDNYYLAFPDNSPLQRRAVNEDGLLQGELQEFAINENKTFSLDQNTFTERALVLENTPHKSISLRHIHSTKSIDLHYENFPNLTLWGQPEADFICLEPCLGLGDFVDHNQKLQSKSGILKLNSAQHFQASCQLIINSQN